MAFSPLRWCRQRVEAYNESLHISASIFSAVRRCPELSRDRAVLPAVLVGCCSENPLAARHSFAILAEQATANPATVSQVRVRAAGPVCFGWLAGRRIGSRWVRCLRPPPEIRFCRRCFDVRFWRPGYGVFGMGWPVLRVGAPGRRYVSERYHRGSSGHGDGSCLSRLPLEVRRAASCRDLAGMLRCPCRQRQDKFVAILHISTGDILENCEGHVRTGDPCRSVGYHPTLLAGCGSQSGRGGAEVDAMHGVPP